MNKKTYLVFIDRNECRGHSKNEEVYKRKKNKFCYEQIASVYIEKFYITVDWIFIVWRVNVCIMKQVIFDRVRKNKKKKKNRVSNRKYSTIYFGHRFLFWFWRKLCENKSIKKRRNKLLLFLHCNVNNPLYENVVLSTNKYIYFMHWIQRKERNTWSIMVKNGNVQPNSSYLQ